MALPALSVILGAGGAFVTMSAADKEDALVNKFGHLRITPNNCVLTNVLCQTEQTPNVCMYDASNQLWGKYSPGDQSCPEPLYRIQD